MQGIQPMSEILSPPQEDLPYSKKSDRKKWVNDAN